MDKILKLELKRKAYVLEEASTLAHLLLILATQEEITIDDVE